MAVHGTCRPAHKVCGEAVLAALLGLPANKEPYAVKLGVSHPWPPRTTFQPDDVQPYALCKRCREQELWYPPSQERGVCARCWRAMDAEGTP